MAWNTTSFTDLYPGVETWVQQVIGGRHGRPTAHYELWWVDGPTVAEAQAALPHLEREGFRGMVREISGPARILGLGLIHTGSFQSVSEGTAAPEAALAEWFTALNAKDFRTGVPVNVLDRIEILQVLLCVFAKSFPALAFKWSGTDEKIREEMTLVENRWEDTLLFLSEETRFGG